MLGFTQAPSLLLACSAVYLSCLSTLFRSEALQLYYTEIVNSFIYDSSIFYLNSTACYSYTRRRYSEWSSQTNDIACNLICNVHPVGHTTGAASKCVGAVSDIMHTNSERPARSSNGMRQRENKRWPAGCSVYFSARTSSPREYSPCRTCRAWSRGAAGRGRAGEPASSPWRGRRPTCTRSWPCPLPPAASCARRCL